MTGMAGTDGGGARSAEAEAAELMRLAEAAELMWLADEVGGDLPAVHALANSIIDHIAARVSEPGTLAITAACVAVLAMVRTHGVGDDYACRVLRALAAGVPEDEAGDPAGDPG